MKALSCQSRADESEGFVVSKPCGRADKSEGFVGSKPCGRSDGNGGFVESKPCGRADRNEGFVMPLALLSLSDNRNRVRVKTG